MTDDSKPPMGVNWDVSKDIDYRVVLDFLSYLEAEFDKCVAFEHPDGPTDPETQVLREVIAWWKDNHPGVWVQYELERKRPTGQTPQR